MYYLSRIPEMSQKQNYIWYACYGSNINTARFIKYINHCEDKTPPVEERPYIFAHDIYFAGKSRTWNNKAVAFLDDSKPGMAYGKIYKITEDQYETIKRKEGPNYTKKIEFDPIDGIPVYTFTDIEKRNDIGVPSLEYFRTILDGLKALYREMVPVNLEEYLVNTIVEADEFQILKAIRTSEHGISNKFISELTNLSLDVVKQNTAILVQKKLIKQDGRSIAAGHSVADNDAYFYTIKGNRDLIQLILEIKTSQNN